MNIKIEESWKRQLASEFEQTYFGELVQFVRSEYANGPCYPPGALIFNAFNLCPFEKVEVVIIGQDPYHEPGQAEGLCFSVADGVPFPPSLQNIFKEIEADLGRPVPASGSLRRWAEQGVLLLNATLTVRAHFAVHRCCDCAVVGQTRASRLYPLGQLCAAKRGCDRPFAPPGADFGTSFAFVCLPGIFRESSFQFGE